MTVQMVVMNGSKLLQELRDGQVYITQVVPKGGLRNGIYPLNLAEHAGTGGPCRTEPGRWTAGAGAGANAAAAAAVGRAGRKPDSPVVSRPDPLANRGTSAALA